MDRQATCLPPCPLWDPAADPGPHGRRSRLSTCLRRRRPR